MAAQPLPEAPVPDLEINRKSLNAREGVNVWLRIQGSCAFPIFQQVECLLDLPTTGMCRLGRKEVSCLQPRAVSVVEDLVEGPALTSA